MKNQDNTEQELGRELASLRASVAELEVRLKETERLLEESEERFAFALDAAELSFWDWNLTTGKAIWGYRAFKRLGYSPGEIESDIKTWKRLVHPEDWPHVSKTLNDHLAGDPPIYESEHRTRTRAGDWLWILARGKVVERDQDGRPVRLIGISLDITERKRAEEALRQSESKYRTLVENIPQKIFVKDRNSVYMSCNENLARDLGIEPDQCLGKTDYDFFPRELAQKYRADDQRIVESEQTEQLEEEYLQAGQEVWVQTIKTPIRQEDGTVTGILGIFWDISDRKKAEEALRESEEKFSTAFRSAPNPMLISTLEDGKVVEVNDEWVATYGYERSEVLGRTAAELGIWTDADSRSSWLRQIMNEGYARNVDLSFSTKDGRLRQGLLSTVTIQLQGKPFLLSTFNDVTDLKKSEEALREREHTLRSILVATPVGLCLTENRLIKWANAAWERMFGFTDESEYVGQPTSIMYGSEEQYLTAREAIYGNLASRMVGETYTDFARRDGSRFHGHLRSTCIDPSDPGKGTLSAISDLTEITRSEQARRASEERYRVLFEDSIDPVFVTAQDGSFIEANRAFCVLFGYERKELEGLKSKDTYADPAQRRIFQEVIEKTGSITDFPLQFRKKDGTVFEGFLTASLRYGDKGDTRCYQGIIRDMTERRLLERQLQQAQKMEAIGTLAAGVAHDFNNILTITQGFSELLLMETDEKASGYSDLRKINEAGRRGAELVRNLLTFSRKAETNPRRINLNEEVVRVEKLLGRTIPKMIRIELHLEGDLATVNADPDQMAQVLMNLAVNAEHAMPDGGQLTIATSNISLDEEYCISHPETQTGTYVLLSISDTGHGMDKETLEHIFEPFFTTKGVGKGTGLGLAMVYGIVQQHGGYVSCHSEPNEGTTFKIYLPALPAAEIESGAEPEQVIPRGGTETILLVDDEDFIRDLGAKFLTRAGYTVLNAAGGPEAVQLYLSEVEGISLVILDLIMPEMGGEECLEEILTINPEAKIIISSGAAVEEKKKKTVELGAKGFVSKPFQLRDMLKTVREVLDSQ